MCDNSQIKQIDLPLFADARGLMTYFEGENQIPFSIKSAYWISAHRDAIIHEDNAVDNQKLVIALSGAIKIKVTVRGQDHVFELRRPHQALLLGKEANVEIYNMSFNSICLVLNSHE